MATAPTATLMATRARITPLKAKSMTLAVRMRHISVTVQATSPASHSKTTRLCAWPAVSVASRIGQEVHQKSTFSTRSYAEDRPQYWQGAESHSCSFVDTLSSRVAMPKTDHEISEVSSFSTRNQTEHRPQYWQGAESHSCDLVGTLPSRAGMTKTTSKADATTTADVEPDILPSQRYAALG
eukprot:552194-Pleurochrysis_carterae.AAC.4